MTVDTTKPHSSSAGNPNSAASCGLLDEQLAIWLNGLKKAKKAVVLVYAGTTCKVYEKDDVRGVICAIDPENRARSAFSALAKSNLLFAVKVSQADIADLKVVASSWVPEGISEKEVVDLLEQRKAKLGRAKGRGDAIREVTANSVWADAGGCCMFRGCGQDLSVVPLYNVGARVAYLAHIIASDPEGPRGTIEDSHRLSDNAENIMLMCDAHHRLIDALAPNAYTTTHLREMRSAHALKVKRYREAMKFTEAQVMTLFADLGNVATHYPDSEFLEALLAEQLSMHPDVRRHLGYRKRDGRTSPDFWGNYLHEMELPIGQMVREMSSQPSADVLAVFPVHHIPTLVLAGRITGEARRVQVFQPSRKRKSWLWDLNAVAHPAGTFKVSGKTDVESSEVLLTIELTAHVDKGAIPNNLSDEVSSGRMPWIRLMLDTPDGECIRRKEDLEQFVTTARSTINFIQDQVRAERVHLIVLSPSSAAFSLGQLMQVGHHAKFTLYDRANHQQPFVEAFTISGHNVVPPAGSAHPPISIR